MYKIVWKHIHSELRTMRTAAIGIKVCLLFTIAGIVMYFIGLVTDYWTYGKYHENFGGFVYLAAEFHNGIWKICYSQETWIRCEDIHFMFQVPGKTYYNHNSLKI